MSTIEKVIEAYNGTKEMNGTVPEPLKSVIEGLIAEAAAAETESAKIAPQEGEPTLVAEEAKPE